MKLLARFTVWRVSHFLMSLFFVLSFRFLRILLIYHSCLLSLDAISKTAFAYDVGCSDQSIPKLLAKLSNVPHTTTTLIASALVDLFPILLKLPSPMMEWTTMLRTELGKIADAVWKQNTEDREHRNAFKASRPHECDSFMVLVSVIMVADRWPRE